MQAYSYRDLDKYLVDAAGRVRLPSKKQQALIRLAAMQGQGSVTVTTLATYERAMLQIFSVTQRPLIEQQLGYYHTHGFAQHEKDNLAEFSERVGMSADQDLAWLDYLGIRTRYQLFRETSS